MGDALTNGGKSYSPTRTIEATWQFDCPEGTWIGRLDRKEWGKSTNLRLYFTDVVNEARYWLSVWHLNSYAPRKGGVDFKRDADAGEVFELTTSKNKSGTPNLISARKITPASCSALLEALFHDTAEITWPARARTLPG
jgi:hypothetical protein